MISVKPVDLSQFGVTLPSERVGMVLCQPHLSLTNSEPYRWRASEKNNQLAAIAETLAISRAANHGQGKTHFTIFPEYSVPGVDGVAAIQSAVEDGSWPVGTIVLGGVDALTKNEFGSLVSSANTFWDGDIAQVGEDRWINCGIIWIKGSDGIVRRWLQPKLSPAWAEQNIHCQQMFQGSFVYLFSGLFSDESRYRFASLICFDWMAPLGAWKAWRWIVEELRLRAIELGSEFSLTWLFVIQHNPKPSHNTFLTEVANFFNHSEVANVRRDRACLVFANTAGRKSPGRAEIYGHTSLIFSKSTFFEQPTCYPTFCNGGKKFRASTLLSDFTDVLLRERGACVHSFCQVNPSSIADGPANRTIPLENPEIYPLLGNVDPRSPSKLVPACVKWLNDELDSVESIGKQYPDSHLAVAAVTTHRANVQALRLIDSKSSCNFVSLSVLASANADLWDKGEVDGVQHVLNCLNILAIGFLLTFEAVPPHTVIPISGKSLDLLAIRGKSHEECISHSRKIFIPATNRKVVMVSRDADNNSWNKRFGSILDTGANSVEGEVRITDPESSFVHLGYRELLDFYLDSHSDAELRGAISAELSK